jgi:hypothetical protein
MNILHRRFHPVRSRDPGPTRPEGVRRVKLPRWFYPVAIVIALAALIVELQPAEMLGFGGARASGAAQRAASPSFPAPDTAAKSGATQDQPFDYFPDHYTDQAKEPAEPIDTF